MMSRPQLEQPWLRCWRVEEPLLLLALVSRAKLTFTLLSALELTSNGWPCTHSSPFTACSCDVRRVCSTRPPLLRSQIAMAPTDDAEARIDGPSDVS